MLNLLRNGTFGRLKLPATRHDVRAAFGEPELWGPQQDQDRCAIWRYDSIEFHFERRSGALTTIFSDHLSPFLIPYDWGIDQWIIDDNLTLTMTEHLLRTEGIDFSVEPPYYPPFEFDDHTHPLAVAFSEATSEVLGAPVPFGYNAGVSDANLFSGEAGIPTIFFGPRAGDFHQCTEWVDVTTIAPCAEVVLRTALKMLA